MGVSRALDGRAHYPTYSALGPRSERPSDYEIATARLHYYVGRGFAVNVPVGAWYARYQEGSPFRCDDWESFADPAETTYTAYTTRGRELELELDALFAQAEARGDPKQLASAWCASLAHTLAPLRYPLHGLHMVACYVGQMAPGGRITAVALFQAGHELRRIDRLAYRTRQLQERLPTFAVDARQRWERAPDWQPLREAIERLLVCYDWGEAFVALNLCLKPMLDELLAGGFAQLCQRAEDEVLHGVLRSFARDAAFQQSWSRALVARACAREDTLTAVRAWVHKWQAPATRALRALAPRLCPDDPTLAAVSAAHERWLTSLPGVRA